jgi:hypothetical protein
MEEPMVRQKELTPSKGLNREHPLGFGGGGGLVKVRFPLGKSNWHGYSSELMWASSGQDETFILENTPFFVMGISYRDSIRAHWVGNELLFRSVAARGGHSTYRLIAQCDPKSSKFQQMWLELQHIGCTYEEAQEIGLYAVDVPAEIDVHKVYSILERGEANGTWDFQEGHCGHDLTRPKSFGSH